MDKPLIQVRDAVCRINSRRTLRVQSFSLLCGQHWCVFGGNGAGKTLFSHLLLGKLRQGQSSVQYTDGFVPQRDIIVVSFEEQQRLWQQDNRLDISEYSESALDQGTTVANLVLGDGVSLVDLERKGSGNFQTERQRFDQLLEALDIAELQHRGIRFLSSGQVRKAMIARAIFQNPRLLVLDDPLESIDRESKERIVRVLCDWQSIDNSSILLSRRRADVISDSKLTGRVTAKIAQNTTHMLLLQELAVIAQGERATVEGSDIFAQMLNNSPRIPDALPAPCSGHAAVEISAAMPLIELSGVSAAWQSQLVLDDVSWTMWQGQHVLIEGPNGCGKSTLLGLINGDNHKAYGQRVRLFGKQRGSGETVWDVKAHFGVVSNELHNRYGKGWRVIDVVVSGFFDSVGLYDDNGASERCSALEWLLAFQMADLAEENYHEISFGQQRLVLLARAMVKHPAVLILDEPCVGLDDWHRTVILETLDVIAAKTATSLIYVSHTVGEHPRCINQFLSFVPATSQQPRAGSDHVSTRSRIPHTLVIRAAPRSP